MNTAQFKNHFFIWVSLIVLFAFAACKPERDNPWDDKSNLDPKDWAPTQLEININSLKSVTLSWKYDTKNIEGFKIDRRKGSEAWQIGFTTLNPDRKSFTDSTITILNAYTYRVYAFAGVNTSVYIEGTTTLGLSSLTTSQIMDITGNSATSGGTVIFDGGAAITARGVCWGTTPYPTLAGSHTTDGTGTGTFVSNLTGLTGYTNYYVRTYATNSAGTTYGNELTFTTLNLPKVTTATVTNITFTTGTSGGTVTADGGATVTARGVCWGTTPNPSLAGNHTTDGTGTGTFASSLTALTASTLYYVRAYVTNSAGTAYGSELTFTTGTCPTTVTDNDGNVYNTVLIGNQCWMKENLKTTKYRNGTSIEYTGTNITNWQNNSTGAYAWYNNDISNKNTYGALYNWYAVNNTNNLCPIGWHVPSDTEWTQLVDYVVAQGYPNDGDIPNGSGNALKSCRQVNSPLGGNCNTTVHPRWDSHGTHYGFDAFGFSALPGGSRNASGYFNTLGTNGGWWSATEYSSASAWYRGMNYSNGYVSRNYYDKGNGFSVRCLRD